MFNAKTRKFNLATMGISVALLMFTLSSGIANATTTTTEISIPVSTVVRNIGVGNSKVLETKDIDEAHRGMVCSVKAEAENQSSVHPGNDLVIASGNSSVTLEDVERAANVSTVAEGELTLADKVSVSLVMGQDNVFSAGMDVVLTCEEPPEEIEVCRDGKVITINEDERLDTDTNAPCPEQIEVCRDGEVVTIDEKDRLDSDTEAPCPVPEKVTVCRDGEVITVLKDEVLETDTLNNCPETLGTQTELPNTGAGVIVSTLLGLSTATTGVYGFVKSRR